MGKIKSVYEKGVDRVWYDSSNIVYSECDDTPNSLKTLVVVFKDGRAYIYFDVNVNDYLLFRESESQGKAFSRYIKQYNFKKIENFDMNYVSSRLEELMKKDETLNKERLFNELEKVSNDILSLINNFRHCKLSNDELSYISYFINKITKNLSLINFTNQEINLLEITDKVETLLNEISENNKEIIDEVSINKIIKEKLLK